MSGGTQVLREYLFSLGFRVDQVQVSKFDKQILTFEKNAFKLGTTLMGVATAAQVMVTTFANQMEKLYYASRRTGASVGNIQALEYGAQQIGLAGGTMTQALEGMARALRANPGLTGLLNSLGVKVTGRDKSDVMRDLVTQLSKMPFYVAQQYAGLFGIDPDTLLMLQQGREEMERAAAARKDMAAAAGVDAEAAAKAGKEYMNMLREVTERLGLLKSAVAIALLPAAHEFAGVINEVLKDWIKIVGQMAKTRPNDGFWTRLWEGLTGTQGRGGSHAQSGPQLTPDAAARAKALGLDGKSPPKAAAAPVDAATLFGGLEQKYGLPPGLLDRMWAQESGRGKNMLSPKGAMGHFQFMPRTASQYGLNNPNDLAESASAAARMLADLSRKYGGDLTKMLAAYNWGQGNVDKYGLGKMPAETLGYVNNVGGGVKIAQENTFNIYGSDAAGTAKMVSRDMDRVNGDLTRNMKGAVR